MRHHRRMPEGEACLGPSALQTRLFAVFVAARAVDIEQHHKDDGQDEGGQDSNGFKHSWSYKYLHYDRRPQRMLSNNHADPSSDISFWLSAGPSCSMPAIVVALL
jgi:hypothetical protein